MRWLQTLLCGAMISAIGCYQVSAQELSSRSANDSGPQVTPLAVLLACQSVAAPSDSVPSDLTKLCGSFNFTALLPDYDSIAEDWRTLNVRPSEVLKWARKFRTGPPRPAALGDSLQMPIFFPSDSAQIPLRYYEYLWVLAHRLAALQSQYPAMRVTISGSADSVPPRVGTWASNHELALARGYAVVAMLLEDDSTLDATRFKVIGRPATATDEKNALKKGQKSDTSNENLRGSEATVTFPAKSGTRPPSKGEGTLNARFRFVALTEASPTAIEAPGIAPSKSKPLGSDWTGVLATAAIEQARRELERWALVEVAQRACKQASLAAILPNSCGIALDTVAKDYQPTFGALQYAVRMDVLGAVPALIEQTLNHQEEKRDVLEAAVMGSDVLRDLLEGRPLLSAVALSLPTQPAPFKGVGALVQLLSDAEAEAPSFGVLGQASDPRVLLEYAVRAYVVNNPISHRPRAGLWKDGREFRRWCNVASSLHEIRQTLLSSDTIDAVKMVAAGTELVRALLPTFMDGDDTLRASFVIGQIGEIYQDGLTNHWRAAGSQSLTLLRVLGVTKEYRSRFSCGLCQAPLDSVLEAAPILQTTEFIGDVANAKTPDQLYAVLQSYLDAGGGYLAKREPGHPTIWSITAFPGAGASQAAHEDPQLAPFLPLGIEWSPAGKEWSGYLQLIDLGGVAAARIGGKTVKSNTAQVFGLGLYLVRNVGTSPISLGIGPVYASGGNVDAKGQLKNVWRLNFFAGVDVPFFSAPAAPKQRKSSRKQGS